MNRIKVNIGGDIYLGRGVEDIAISNPSELFGNNIFKLFAESNLNVLNLESPITECSSENKILKTGPHLKAKPQSLKALKTLNIDLVTLANNHIYDFGDTGLDDTLSHLKINNIDSVGAAKNLRDAQKIYYKKVSNIDLAFINFAENEWSSATYNRGGTNPLDLIENSQSIKDAKLNADFVIVIVHGGHENYQYPSPRMVKQFRYYADQGADIVICHHAHRISGYELYNSVPIFYGIGNFLFDSKSDLPGWNHGFVLSISIEKDKKLSWEILPYSQCINTIGVELLHNDEKNEILDTIDDINKVISDSEKLEQKFNHLAKSSEAFVLSIFSTSNILNSSFIKRVIRRLKLERLFLRKNQIKSILNYTRCEAHYDVTKKVLENYLNPK
ncbi:CapA family protein [Saccharicrinis sp. FJH2]|uniref:CapA family protein n=1 Tax=Saccharicrinis sp. FJH65 TaxID=3344659 RepID=UPI0035F4368B